MGRKGSWFSALKKAFVCEAKQIQDPQKPKKRWLWKQDTAPPSPTPAPLPEETLVFAPPPPPPPPPPPFHPVKPKEAENEHIDHAYSVALASKVAVEAAAVAAQAAAEVARLTAAIRFPGKSNEDIAAIKIQSIIRGYLARKELKSLRRQKRLRSLIRGKSVKRQSASTLRCMQTLARVQSQIRARRMRMSEENRALQRQLHQKHEKELEKMKTSSLQIGEDWNDSAISKEQFEAKIQNRQVAAMRREKALAYAFTSQQAWKNSKNSSPNSTLMDPNNPHWGWSWLERWMDTRPWDNYDRGSTSAFSRSISLGEMSRTNSRKDSNNDSKRPFSASKAVRATKTPSLSSVSSKFKAPRPKSSCWSGDEDANATMTVNIKHRRHSIAGVSMRDNESISIASSTAGSSHKGPKKAMSSKSLLPRNRTMEKRSLGTARKCLSFNVSPAGKHSVPPKADAAKLTKQGSR